MIWSPSDVGIVEGEIFKELIDCDGNHIWNFHKDTPDQYIWTALSFANGAYMRGFQEGEKKARVAMRRALGIVD